MATRCDKAAEAWGSSGSENSDIGRTRSLHQKNCEERLQSLAGWRARGVAVVQAAVSD